MWKWLRERKTENPHWFWALIGVSCWTVMLVTASCGLYFFIVGFSQPTTAADYLAGAFYCFLPFALPIVAVLTGIPWFLLAARRRGWL